MPSKPHICICICSYKRPHLLERLLSHLEQMQTGGHYTFSIVIVDNDKSESSKGVVTQYKTTSSMNIRYLVEPVQNIALARNKAIENATGEYLAWIDDDEIPCKIWLNKLVETIEKYNCDGVLGPVLPYFETPPPEWISKGKFFDRPNHPTGYKLPWFRTRSGNVLIKRSILELREAKFNPEFGSGGEDRNFFKRMIDAGHTFVWCAEAPVYEAVTDQRCQRSFMLRRALKKGQLPQYSTKDYLMSLIAVPLYTISLPILIILGHHLFMNILIRDCDHIGRILSLIGINIIKEKYVIG